MCKNKTRTTVKKYLLNSIIISKPWVENVFAIKQKMPIGAKNIIILKLLSTTSLRLIKKFAIVLPFCLHKEIALPSSKAKKITWSIFPSTSALKGFCGIIFIKTSDSFGAFESSTICSDIELLLLRPGFKNDAITKARVIATEVVKIYKIIVLLED